MSSFAVTEEMRNALGLLTPVQVADLLQVSRDWVYDNAKAGTLPCVKLGKTVRFRPADLEKYLAGDL